MKYLSLLIFSLLCPVLRAANPLYPSDFFADPEAHTWSDGRIYLYCSHDVSTAAYCSDNYHVLSSSDMVHWKDNGGSLLLKDAGITGAKVLYACDCGFIQGYYHLYASTDNGRIFEASPLDS